MPKLFDYYRVSQKSFPLLRGISYCRWWELLPAMEKTSGTYCRSDSDPGPCISGGSGSVFLKSLDPDPDFVPSLDPDPALLSLGRIRIRPNRPGSATLV